MLTPARRTPARVSARKSWLGSMTDFLSDTVPGLSRVFSSTKPPASTRKQDTERDESNDTKQTESDSITTPRVRFTHPPVQSEVLVQRYIGLDNRTRSTGSRTASSGSNSGSSFSGSSRSTHSSADLSDVATALFTSPDSHHTTLSPASGKSDRDSAHSLSSYSRLTHSPPSKTLTLSETSPIPSSDATDGDFSNRRVSFPNLSKRSDYGTTSPKMQDTVDDNRTPATESTGRIVARKDGLSPDSHVLNGKSRQDSASHNNVNILGNDLNKSPQSRLNLHKKNTTTPLSGASFTKPTNAVQAQKRARSEELPTLQSHKKSRKHVTSEGQNVQRPVPMRIDPIAVIRLVISRGRRPPVKATAGRSIIGIPKILDTSHSDRLWEISDSAFSGVLLPDPVQEEATAVLEEARSAMGYGRSWASLPRPPPRRSSPQTAVSALSRRSRSTQLPKDYDDGEISFPSLMTPVCADSSVVRRFSFGASVGDERVHENEPPISQPSSNFSSADVSALSTRSQALITHPTTDSLQPAHRRRSILRSASKMPPTASRTKRRRSRLLTGTSTPSLMMSHAKSDMVQSKGITPIGHRTNRPNKRSDVNESTQKQLLSSEDLKQYILKKINDATQPVDHEQTTRLVRAQANKLGIVKSTTNNPPRGQVQDAHILENGDVNRATSVSLPLRSEESSYSFGSPAYIRSPIPLNTTVSPEVSNFSFVADECNSPQESDSYTFAQPIATGDLAEATRMDHFMGPLHAYHFATPEPNVLGT